MRDGGGIAGGQGGFVRAESAHRPLKPLTASALLFLSLLGLFHHGLLAGLPASHCLGRYHWSGHLLRGLGLHSETLWSQADEASEPLSEMLSEVLAMAKMVSLAINTLSTGKQLSSGLHVSPGALGLRHVSAHTHA